MIRITNPIYHLSSTQSVELRGLFNKVRAWVPTHKLNHLAVVLSALEVKVTHRQLYLMVSIFAEHLKDPLPNWIFDFLTSKTACE